MPILLNYLILLKVNMYAVTYAKHIDYNVVLCTLPWLCTLVLPNRKHDIAVNNRHLKISGLLL